MMPHKRLVGGPVVTKIKSLCFLPNALLPRLRFVCLPSFPATLPTGHTKFSIRLRRIKASSICASGSARATRQRTSSTPQAPRLVSRLTYSHFAIFTGEGVARFDFNNGWFTKGYVGGGGLWSGNLKDEDFPPAHRSLFGDHKRAEVRFADIWKRRCAE